MKYVPNPRFASAWLATDEALETIRPFGPPARQLAAQLAPRRLDLLAESIEDQYGHIDGVATVRINARDFKAHWWEFGHEGRSQPFLRPAVTQIVGPVQG